MANRRSKHAIVAAGKINQRAHDHHGNDRVAQSPIQTGLEDVDHYIVYGLSHNTLILSDLSELYLNRSDLGRKERFCDSGRRLIQITFLVNQVILKRAW